MSRHSICPDCGGSGYARDVVPSTTGGKGLAIVRIPCARCSGTGMISGPDWIMAIGIAFVLSCFFVILFVKFSIEPKRECWHGRTVPDNKPCYERTTT